VIKSAKGALVDRHLNQLYRRALAKPPEVYIGGNNVAAQVPALLASPSVAMQDKPPGMQPTPVALELEGSEIPSETVAEPSVPKETPQKVEYIAAQSALRDVTRPIRA
jgi:hypothetical protein